MNLKEFWQKGIVEMTPLNQLYAKAWSLWGSVFSIAFAIVYFALNGMWYLDFWMFFMGLLQVVDLIGTMQQYRNLKKMMGGVVGGRTR